MDLGGRLVVRSVEAFARLVRQCAEAACESSFEKYWVHFRKHFRRIFLRSFSDFRANSRICFFNGSGRFFLHRKHSTANRLRSRFYVKSTMSRQRPLRGACSCGRNHYAIVVPTESTEQAQVYFDDSSESSKLSFKGSYGSES